MDELRSRLARRPETVAPELLGWVLVTSDSSGVIVEVEAYGGSDDEASHAHNGPTPRCSPMFGEVGHLYVYRSYGMHWCANVVVHGPDEPGAVLIRAIEPSGDIEAMSARRRHPVPRLLGAGPGRLTEALGITGNHNGLDLLAPSNEVRLIPGSLDQNQSVERTPRIGISRATQLPWRFSIADNRYRSRS